jgi:hypothetical protein
MSLHSQFKMDEKKEAEGVDVVVGVTNDDGTIPTFRVLRRAAQNQRYTKALERESAPFRRLLELGTLDNKTQFRILRSVFVSSVLIGWSHVQDQKGAEIPYNSDNATKLFEELPELYLEIAEQAGKLSSFRAETQESDAKN